MGEKKKVNIFFTILVSWCEPAKEPRSAGADGVLQLGAETGRKEQGKEDRKQGWGIRGFLLLSAIRCYGLDCLWNCSLEVKLYAHFKLIKLFTAARRRKSSHLRGPNSFAGSCHAVACDPSLHSSFPAGFLQRSDQNEFNNRDFQKRGFVEGVTLRTQG